MKDFTQFKKDIDEAANVKQSPKPSDQHKANPSKSIRDKEEGKGRENKQAKKPSDNYTEEKLDPVNKKAVKKDFDDRKDKDIDNDGDVDDSDEYLHNRRKTIGKAMKKEDLEKEPDDPCWEGYVQVGTKMQNGKEVPNCVPMEEARRRIKNEQSSYEDDIDPNKKVVVKGTKGMNSKSFTKKFRNMKAADKWMDDNEGDIEVKQVMNESVLSEMYHDAPDYGSAGASDMAITQLYFIKYAALEVIECLKAGVVMPEWYQNKIAKLEGDMEGIHSYMEGKKMRMKHTEHDRMKSRYMPGMGRGMYEQTQLTEKAESEAQQKAAAVALAVKRGEQPESALQGASRDMYDSMTEKELEDFAKTSHEGIPAKKGD